MRSCSATFLEGPSRHERPLSEHCDCPEGPHRDELVLAPGDPVQRDVNRNTVNGEDERLIRYPADSVGRSLGCRGGPDDGEPSPRPGGAVHGVPVRGGPPCPACSIERGQHGTVGVSRDQELDAGPDHAMENVPALLTCPYRARGRGKDGAGTHSNVLRAVARNAVQVVRCSRCPYRPDRTVSRGQDRSRVTNAYELRSGPGYVSQTIGGSRGPRRPGDQVR